VCEVGTGGTPNTAVKEYYENGTVKWMKSADVKGLYVRDVPNRITEKGLANSNALLHPAGTVMMAMSGRGKTRGMTAVLATPCTCSQSVAAMIPDNEKLLSEFLHYDLQFRYEEIRNITGSYDRSGLNLRLIRDIKIPIPRLQEQRKITDILLQVDFSIQKTDEIIAKTQQLKKGLIQQLLTKGIGHTKFKQTEIGEIPEEWEVSTIGKECKVGTGGTPSRRKPDYYNGNIPWVKTTELNYNVINSTEERITERAVAESNAEVYPRGTLLIAMYGLEAPGTRGKCAILGIDAATNQACAALRPMDRVHIPFLFYYYQLLRKKLMSLAGGTKRQNLSLGIIKSIRIPVPSIDEQTKIADVISTIDDKIADEKWKNLQLQQLKKGLMQVLLTGKVRVKVD